MFSSTLKQIRVCDSHDVVALIASAPTQRDRQGLCPLIAACHADFIQRFDLEGRLRQTIGRHEALMTASQRHLRKQRKRLPLLRVSPTVL